jgi:hypothetical protein
MRAKVAEARTPGGSGSRFSGSKFEREGYYSLRRGGEGRAVEDDGKAAEELRGGLTADGGVRASAKSDEAESLFSPQVAEKRRWKAEIQGRLDKGNPDHVERAAFSGALCEQINEQNETSFFTLVEFLASLATNQAVLDR